MIPDWQRRNLRRIDPEWLTEVARFCDLKNTYNDNKKLLSAFERLHALFHDGIPPASAAFILTFEGYL